MLNIQGFSILNLSKLTDPHKTYKINNTVVFNLQKNDFSELNPPFYKRDKVHFWIAKIAL